MAFIYRKNAELSVMAITPLISSVLLESSKPVGNSVDSCHLLGHHLKG